MDNSIYQNLLECTDNGYILMEMVNLRTHKLEKVPEDIVVKGIIFHNKIYTVEGWNREVDENQKVVRKREECLKRYDNGEIKSGSTITISEFYDLIDNDRDLPEGLVINGGFEFSCSSYNNHLKRFPKYTTINGNIWTCGRCKELLSDNMVINGNIYLADRECKNDLPKDLIVNGEIVEK